MELPGLPFELVRMIVNYNDITQRDRCALARVNKAHNRKVSGLLYHAVVFSGSYRAANGSLVATSIRKNIECFSRTLVEFPQLAGIVRSVTIESACRTDTDEHVTMNLQRILGMLSNLESFYLIGSLQRSRSLNSPPTLEWQPLSSTLKELTLSTYGITKSHALAILQQPKLKKLSIISIKSPSAPLPAVDVQLKTSSFPALEHLELGSLVQHDAFTASVLRRCHTLKSLSLKAGRADGNEGGEGEIPLRQLLAPLFDTLQSLKLRGNTGPQGDSTYLNLNPYARLDFVDFKNLRCLDVERRFLFSSNPNDNWFSEIVPRDYFYLLLPKSLESLTVKFPGNSSVVDNNPYDPDTASKQPINENCEWIEKLALRKSEYFPGLRHVKFYEEEFMRKNKSWNAPQQISTLYRRNGIRLEVSVRPLSVYESNVERDHSVEYLDHMFFPCHTRDLDLDHDAHFTVPEVEMSSSQDATIKSALEIFPRKMREGNKLFLMGRVEEIRSLNPPTEKDELDKMSRFWFEGYPAAEWPSPGSNQAHVVYRSTSRIYETFWAQETAVTSIDELLLLEHPLSDGMDCGDAKFTPPWDRDQIEMMERWINKKAGMGEDGPLRMNDEFISFVKYAPRGVRDPDFRKSSICEFLPRWTPRGNYCVPCNENPDEGTWYFQSDEDGNQSFEADGQKYDLLTYTQAGRTRCPWNSHVMGLLERIWTSYYVFCKKTEKNAPDIQRNHELYTEENGWQWRILFFDDRFETGVFAVYLFDSIVEFLEWYGSWYDRLDMTEVRKSTEPFPGMSWDE
ncbi:hypothetical protein ONS95_001244 [Cadophora gregata]|uniref:uncharacterized protein n=1 Tax=Cadophora gregata TaxID=51156 RepID=UPI0026DCB69D|nr:uncharacterized protein ONS95_001244 [Cadophora gregata]KAK0101947.1 hypothetical protein ONS96_005917 [Cadophora gregata f. sp. sojae]KAK0129312.1 hypothetical protein ONS95_001244 [Cadophora gregata]